MKRKIKIRFLICSLLLIGMICTGCGASAGNSGYADAKNGVAVVHESVSLDGEEVGIGYGSGFFVGNAGEDPQYLITNYHVIEQYLYYGAGQGDIFTDENGVEHALKGYIRVYFDASDYVEAYVVDYNAIADVAVLKTEFPVSKRKALPLCVPTEDMVSSSVYAIGFPSAAENYKADSVRKWGLNDSTFTSGVISRLVTTSGSGVHHVQIDVEISSGNSGGPLVNQSGQVVGINTWGLVDENMNYATNIDEAITLLKLHSVPYSTGAEKSGQGNLIVLILAGVVLIIAIAAIVIIMAAKKKKKKAASQFPATAPAASKSSAGKGAKSEDTGFRLQGVSGALAGQRFMIKKGTPLIIGRNPDICNVVYPSGTAGVSGKHCQVWYDGGSIYLKDLGSSHGTFLASGAKASAGQSIRLTPGESFSLGSGEETMVLAQKGGR